MNATCIKCHAVVCLDHSGRIFDDGAYMVIEGNRIKEIGFQKDLAASRQFDQTVDLGHRLVMPGLINAHTHTPMTLFRGPCGRPHAFQSEGLVQHHPCAGTGDDTGYAPARCGCLLR